MKIGGQTSKVIHYLGSSKYHSPEIDICLGNHVWNGKMEKELEEVESVSGCCASLTSVDERGRTESLYYECSAKKDSAEVLESSRQN